MILRKAQNFKPLLELSFWKRRLSPYRQGCMSLEAEYTLCSRVLGLKNVVLHSFTHLAEMSASPQFAEAFLQSAAERLRNTGYQVTLTPFGWVCEWELAVFGESLAKVFKSL